MTVQDPSMIDFVVHDPRGEVVLVMVEHRDWDGSNERLLELQEKINSYVSYAFDGQLIDEHPEFAGKPVRLELRYVSPPDPKTIEFLDVVRNRLKDEGVDFAVKQIGAKPLG